MPTEMVGYIRRSLESSQCSVSSCCSSNNSYKQTSSRTQQRNLTSSPNGNCDSCSEESDEAESTYFGIEPSPEKSDHPSTLNLDLENLPDAFSAVKHYTTSQVSVQSDTQNYNRNGKPCLRQHLRNGLQNNPLSMKAQGDLDNKDMHTNNDLRDRSGNISELAEVDLVLGNEDPELRDYISDDLAGANYISDYLAFSDSVIFGNNGNILFPGGEDNVCDFFSSIDSHGLDSIQANSPNGFHQRSLDDMEDVEVSSTASMSSILGRALNMDFDDQYNGRDSSMVNVHNIIELHDKETDSREKFSITEDRSPASRQHDDVFSQCSTTESVEESCSAIHFETEGNHAKILSFPEEIVKPHIRESQKLDVCGDSLVPGIVFSMENASLAENHKSSRALDLKKVVSCVSDLSPNFNHESSNDTSLDSVHHEICMEGKVSCHKGSLEGNGSLVCSLGNEDVIPVKLAGCLESHELQNGTISSHNFTCPVNEHDSRTENAPISNNDNGKIVTGGGHQTYTDNSRTAHQSSIGNKDIGNGINVGTSNEKFSNEIDDRYARQENPRRNLLLNTVVTGTTLIGALFFLLHIRKGKERIDKPPVLMKAQQFGGTKPASRRGQTNKSTGTYPAEKLKFGN
ncbi:OLC1v1008470C2 [Oldenlandia corymbosa var. corymbosa]|nr:OLC1v1008470C2 [Oldenlandia corymbosa var. corymbosa]